VSAPPAEFAEVETARLRLRRLTAADLPALIAYRNDPEVARYQNWETFSAEEADAFLREQDATEPGTPGSWFEIAMEEKASGTMVGDCALHVRKDDPRQGEIGFSLSRAHQGRGLASEAVAAVLDYAFGTLGLHRIIAVTDARNAASAALLERIGMRREGHFIQNIWFKGAWGDELQYAVLAEEWLARRTAERSGG
jgi:RimJ/RimL family protein N-acetyltransferase